MSDPTANRLDVLRSSVARLRALVEPLDAAQLRASAYPAEWNVADVLSHIGSSTVIMQAGIDDEPRRTSDGCRVRGDRVGHLEREGARGAGRRRARSRTARSSIASTRSTPRSGRAVSVSLGPMMFGFDEVVGLRVNEHLVHTWDVAVTFDPAATLPADGTATMIDNLGIVGRFWGKPIGVEHAVHVHTTAPERDFVIMLGMDAVTMEPTTRARRGRTSSCPRRCSSASSTGVSTPTTRPWRTRSRSPSSAAPSPGSDRWVRWRGGCRCS